MTRRYRRLDVTRADVVADNEKAREVAQALGPVAEVVLQGKLLPQFGPVRASGAEDEAERDEDGAGEKQEDAGRKSEDGTGG